MWTRYKDLAIFQEIALLNVSARFSFHFWRPRQNSWERFASWWIVVHHLRFFFAHANAKLAFPIRELIARLSGTKQTQRLCLSFIQWKQRAEQLDSALGATLMLNLIGITIFTVGMDVFIRDASTITNSVYPWDVTDSEIRLLQENITVTRNINSILQGTLSEISLVKLI